MADLLLPAPPIFIPFFTTVPDRTQPGGIKITGMAPIWYNWIHDTIVAATSGVVSDDPYGVAWNSVIDIAPSKNAVYDEIETVIALISSSVAAIVSDTVFSVAWNGVTTIAPSKNAVYDKITAMISDDAYGPGWNGVIDVAPSKNAVYDEIEVVIALIATSVAAVVSDAVYGAGWNGVTTIAPSKNAVYDKIEAIVSDAVYGAGWNGVTTIAPSKNAVYDKIEAIVSDAVYGAGWNGVTDVAPSKNAVYDRLEATAFFTGSLAGDITAQNTGVVRIPVATDAADSALMIGAGDQLRVWQNGVQGIIDSDDDIYIRPGASNTVIFDIGAVKISNNLGLGKSPTTTSILAIGGYPTSAVGLATGDVWIDTAAAYVFKVVP